MVRKPSSVALGRLLSGEEILETHSPLVDYPDHVNAIGMISVEMANLEFSLGAFLGSILHVSPANGRIVFLTPQSGAARLSIIDNILDDGEMSFKAGTNGFKHAKKLVEKAKSVIGRRNDIIHHSWGVVSNVTDASVATRKMPFKKSVGFKIVPLIDLLDLISRIRKLNGDVISQTEENYRSWPAYSSQPIPPEPDSPDPSQTHDAPQTKRAPKPKAPPRSSRGKVSG